MKKKIFTHVGIIALLTLTAALFFSPVFDGKAIRQGDMEKARAMEYEQETYHRQTGEYTSWTSSMFSGMPSYQVYSKPQTSVIYAI